MTKSPAVSAGRAEDDESDLEARLARLRARIAAEGRGSAVKTIDKAIARASERRAKRARSE